MQAIKLVPFVLASTLAAHAYQGEIPAGTRFMVELRNDLHATKVKRGKKFEARTIEPIRAMDSSVIPAGAKLKGRVSHAENNRLLLRFEEIETPRGKRPLVATVIRVPGEKHVEEETSAEGEIRAEGSRGRNAAIGALVVGGIGAAVGASKAGGKGAAIGAGSGAGAGAAIGAASGGRDLELDKGARLELRLDRPIAIR